MHIDASVPCACSQLSEMNMVWCLTRVQSGVEQNSASCVNKYLSLDFCREFSDFDLERKDNTGTCSRDYLDIYEGDRKQERSDIWQSLRCKSGTFSISFCFKELTGWKGSLRLQPKFQLTFFWRLQCIYCDRFCSLRRCGREIPFAGNPWRSAVDVTLVFESNDKVTGKGKLTPPLNLLRR